MDDGRFEQALAALLQLRKRVPKHKTVLAMLGTCYERLGDWQALHELLPEIADRKAVADKDIKRWSRQVWTFMMTGEDELAKCLCHELDHLDGIVFTQKVYEWFE